MIFLLNSFFVFNFYSLGVIEISILKIVHHGFLSAELDFYIRSWYPDASDILNDYSLVNATKIMEVI